MAQKILIKAGSVLVEGVLGETFLSEAITQLLPYCSLVNKWGDEVYIQMPLGHDISRPVGEVEKGDIAYWPGSGGYLCLFYGRTPMSRGDKPVPVSDVEVVGRMSSNYAELAGVEPGEKISIEEI